jgi:hypothetical protein
MPRDAIGVQAIEKAASVPGDNEGRKTAPAPHLHEELRALPRLVKSAGF